MRGLVRQLAYTPGDLGLSAIALNTANLASTAVGIRGFNQLTIHYELTRVAATDISFYVAHKPDGASRFGRLRVGDLDPATGIETMRLRQFVIPDVATAASQNGEIDIAINGDGSIQLQAITGTLAGATDLLTMWLTLGVV